MKIIDAHIHLWDIEKMYYPWLTDVPKINHSFLMSDYKKAVKEYEVKGCVFVECACKPVQSLEEIIFAEDQLFEEKIIGIVPYAPLENASGIKAYLQKIATNPLVKGVRRMTSDEPGICLSACFLEAVKMLPTYNLTLDISVKPFQIKEIISMIEQCPETSFILDHLGKPNIAHNGFEAYRQNIAALSSLPNVVAKISGLVTEANWDNWTEEDLKPYILFAIEKFGFSKLMFGSDWPVVTLAGTYKKWIETLMGIINDCSSEDKTNFFYNNAIKIYQLKETA